MATFVRGSPVSTLGPVMIGHRLVCPVLMAEIDHSGVERAKHLGRVQDSVRASLRLLWYLEVVTQCCPFCISQLSPTALPSLLPPPPPTHTLIQDPQIQAPQSHSVNTALQMFASPSRGHICTGAFSQMGL